MEELLNISEVIQELVENKTSLEELVDRALSGLYKLEARFLAFNVVNIRNDIRAIIACVKVLYDCGQQMMLVRMYLLHKIKLLEVREKDIYSEVSVLRANSSNGSDDDGVVAPVMNADEQIAEDNELSIIMDARMIKDIDMSRGALRDISQLISSKKQEIQEIERSMDGVSDFLSLSTEAQEISVPALELLTSIGSMGIECSPNRMASLRSRVEDTCKISSIYTTMAMSQDKMENLLPQGVLGSPRGRQSSEPDAAGSTALERESCEGTAGVEQVSAPTEQVATDGEKDGSGTEDAAAFSDEMEVIPHMASGKRKASVSPDVEDEEDDNVSIRRPIKARIFESRSDGSDSFTEQMSCNDDRASGVSGSLEQDTEGIDTPVGRRSTRNKCRADFSQLTEARQRKIGKSTVGVGSDSDSVDRIIDPIVKRLLEEKAEGSRISRSSSENSVAADSSRRVVGSSDDSLGGSCKKNKDKISKKSEKDAVVRSSGKSRRKVSIIVPKNEAECEAGYCREDWLKLDGAELGARCLDYLEEWEQQRRRCSNISGMVAGRMIESKGIATEITKALIEKITTVGDFYGLRTENQSLKDELAEIKRREEAHNTEIIALRRMVSNLEKEVRSLKEGLGPFAAPDRLVKRPRSPEISSSRAKEKIVVAKDPFKDRKDRKDVFVVDDPIDGEPGCSKDEAYMQRHDWPSGSESVSWMNEVNLVNKVSDEKGKTEKGSLGCLDSGLRSGVRSSSGKGIRIIEDKQIVPPFSPSLPPSDNEWKRVGRRGAARRVVLPKSPRRVDVLPSPGPNRQVKASKGKPARRFIRPAVVTITNKNSGVSYAEILTKAREKVSLKDIGISDTVVRRAMNGAIVIEVPGPAGKQLASTLKSRLAEALGEDAKVVSPVATGEVRLRGIDLSTTAEDILEELMVLSGAGREDFKISPISNMRDGMGIAWITCPLEAAVKIAEQGILRIGWTRVRVELLKKRPIQCFRCWHFGHVQTNCKTAISRVGACFRCSEMGHTAKLCKAGKSICAICAEVGKEARHRLGSPRCLENQGFPGGVQLIKKPLARRSQVAKN